MTTPANPGRAPHAAAGTEFTRRDPESAIQDLLSTLMDGVRGYETAADKVDDAAIAATMTAHAKQRRESVGELLRVASDTGVAPPDLDVDSTVTGAMHRAWLALEGAVAGDDSVISSAINGEEHALSETNDVLTEYLPEDVAKAVRRIADEIADSIDDLQDLRRA